MELLAFAGVGLAMIVVVFGVGVGVQVLFDRRFGVSRQRHDPKSQAHQQAVRSQLGSFGTGDGSQH